MKKLIPSARISIRRKLLMNNLLKSPVNSNAVASSALFWYLVVQTNRDRETK
jgi:hypothetical protein